MSAALAAIARLLRVVPRIAKTAAPVVGRFVSKTARRIAAKPLSGVKLVTRRGGTTKTKLLQQTAAAAAKKSKNIVIKAHRSQKVVARRQKLPIGRRIANVPKALGKWAWRNKGALLLTGASIGIPLGISGALQHASDVKSDIVTDRYLAEVMKHGSNQQPLSATQHIPPSYYGGLSFQQGQPYYSMSNRYLPPADFSIYGGGMYDDQEEEDDVEEEKSINKKVKKRKKAQRRRKKKKNND